MPANLLPAMDCSAFDQLKMLIDSEGSGIADPDWRGMLAAIGIERGKPFDPDARTRALLDQAATAGYNMSRALAMDEIVGQRVVPRPPGPPLDQPLRLRAAVRPRLHDRTTDGELALDARINWFTNYYSISPGMVSRTAGQGANYMVAWVDSDGDTVGQQDYT